PFLGFPFPDYALPKEPTLEETQKQGFTQAGGRVPFGVTAFTVKTKGVFPHSEPEETVTHVRTDVAPRLATRPFADPRCTDKEFGQEVAEGVFLAPGKECVPAEIGVNKVIVFLKAADLDVPLEGKVYNLEPGNGLASKFGVALNLTPLGDPGLFAH